MKIKKYLTRALLLSLGILVLFFSSLVVFITDWWWFSEVGFTEVFFRSLLTKVGVGVGVGVFAVLFLGINTFIALRSRVAWHASIPEHLAGRPLTLDSRVLRVLALVVSAFLGALIGLAASALWKDVLKFVYAVPFGIVDPLFGKDLSFYIFSLPVYSLALGILQFLVVASLILCGIVYFFQGVLHLRKILPYALQRMAGRSVQAEVVSRKPRAHLGILLALFFLISAISTLLAMYQLTLSSGGVVFGATAAQSDILRPLLVVSAATFALSALFSLLFALSGKLMPLLGSITLSLVVAVGVSIAPPVYQKLIVAPNELNQEMPYIKRNIASTRAAYGVENIKEREIAAEKSLTAQDIAANDPTLKNVRLWDREPLLSTFSQIQEIRTYYEFRSVDNDRYSIGGDLRQIMLSPRELAADSLPNKSWINERLAFTHGYGMTAGPVNQVTPEGLPVLFVKDLPPKSDVPELQITRPEIYYGELANDYVIVKTKSLEFDYPKGEENVYTTYEGTGGVQISSLFQRLIYAIKYKEPKILLSGDITGTSRILTNRVISERVSKAAPFLIYDHDPYAVIANGRLVWILDAYTATSRYPYSQPISLNGKTVNYVRNSVKAVVDAYNGSIDLYIADPNDPIIKTYARAFPNTFRSMSDFPKELVSHLRYPEDIFSAQTAMYSTYHMDDPQVFYNKEDLWEIPSYAEQTTQQAGRGAPMEARHMIMKLPGEKKEEFILMVPFTPRSKDNLSAWMVARNDGEHIGSLVVYRFPKDKLIFGPKQVIGRINQDADVSRQISLWDQRGSQVIQGPLLVIPIEESLVYVRPLYLKAESGKIPELKRVIVAYENKVAMEETLEKALAKIFGSGESKPEASEVPTTTEPTQPTSPSVAGGELQKARDAYDAALRAQKEGDWTQYGEHIRKLGDILRTLAK